MCKKSASVTGNSRIPDVTLNNKVLKWINEHKSLGVGITHDVKDDLDIKKAN